MAKRRFIEEATGEEYVHKAVWLVAKRNLKHAEAHPRGAQLDHLVAQVFASHALEGYANFLGEKVAPDLWSRERELFRDTGLAGKLEALHERCGVPLWKKGRRPWSTIRELKRLRDGVAHPRTKSAATTTEYVDGKEPPLFAKGWIDGVVSQNKAVRAIEDVKTIVDRLHEAAMARFPRSNLLPDGLEGILSMRSTSSRLKE
jgi:hypothetical protein